jgi:two-component system phosphate regulon response regulator PhoB
MRPGRTSVPEPHRILIVDDDAFIRRPLEHIFRAEGYDPVSAGDGDECLRLVREDPPSLIFLDLMMPGKDGFEVCRLLKSDPRYADIPIVLLSAREHESDRSRGLALGAEDFISKPYSPVALLRRVREILETDPTGDMK